ncbi:hypothetical protein [Janibacter sp. GS2]|uniref:hypothetical protein n=1 Tax=Janibacter sp. GS2 TaxID=3442646 RepID=UPI003EBF9610
MSTRPDGMPQGHPEKRSIPIAQLTILSSSTDPDDPSFDVHGELRILVPAPAGREAEVVDVVRGIMRQVLDSENVATFAISHGGRS